MTLFPCLLGRAAVEGEDAQERNGIMNKLEAYQEAKELTREIQATMRGSVHFCTYDDGSIHIVCSSSNYPRAGGPGGGEMSKDARIIFAKAMDHTINAIGNEAVVLARKAEQEAAQAAEAEAREVLASLEKEKPDGEQAKTD